MKKLMKKKLIIKNLITKEKKELKKPQGHLKDLKEQIDL